jgi:hypothetical protein
MLNRYSGSLHKSLKLNKFEFLSRTAIAGTVLDGKLNRFASGRESEEKKRNFVYGFIAGNGEHYELVNYKYFLIFLLTKPGLYL